MVKTTETSVDVRIGANVAAARKDAELSQAALAKALTEISGLEWNERLIARMESGDRPLRYSEAAALAQALSVPVGAFLDGTNGPAMQTAEIGRVGRAMKTVNRASQALTEAVNGMIHAQEEYRLAALAADTQLRRAWSDAELEAVRRFIRMTWEDVGREADHWKDDRDLPAARQKKDATSDEKPARAEAVVKVEYDVQPVGRAKKAATKGASDA